MCIRDRVEGHPLAVFVRIHHADIVLHFAAVFPVGDSPLSVDPFGQLAPDPRSHLDLVAAQLGHQAAGVFLVVPPVDFTLQFGRRDGPRCV